MSVLLAGVGASKGIAIGELAVVMPGSLEVQTYSVPKSRVDAEIERFERALEHARQSLRDIRDNIPAETAADVAEFMNVHLLMLEDSAITKAPIELIRERRCNAEWALRIQRDAVMEVFEAMDDPYLRTRKDDVDHVVRQVQRYLAEERTPTRADTLHLANRIVFADDLAPADAAQMENQGVSALLTEYGGATSHTAILARSLGVPAVVGLHRARPYLREGETVIVDGRAGVVIVAPDRRMTRYYQNRQRDIARHHARRSRLRRGPAITADGQRVVLQANVELAADIESARRLNAEGIGLYRTEGLYMNRRTPPDEDEQLAAYAEIVERMRGAPVTIRTMDLGADKQVDGVRPGAPASSNPALGLRAVRLCLREPALFRHQLRAILRASALGPVRMLVPMISSVQEVVQVKQILRECHRQLDRRGEAYDRTMPIGAMIEVPAAALCADVLVKHLDFLSIGTNDLIQYTIAIDRVDDEVNYLYDPIHPAVLRLIKMTLDAGHARRVPVAMCGEMAGDARYTRLLLGLGLREFSVHPNALLEVKQIIGRCDARLMRKLSRRVLSASKDSTRLAIIEQMNASTS